MVKIQAKRGTLSTIPVLAEGEIAFTTDTHEFFAGTAGGTNVKIGPSTGGGGGGSGGAVADQARYHQATPQSIAFNATPTVVNFDTQDWDDSSLVTTGASWKFTAALTGRYRFAVLVNFGAVDWNNNHNTLYLYKNGTQLETIDVFFGAAGIAMSSIVRGVDEIALTAGDYIDIRVVQQAGTGGSINLVSAWINVERSDIVGGERELDYVQVTSNQSTSSATLVDVTSLSLTVTVGPRPLMVEAYCAEADNSVDGDACQLALYDVTGSAVVQLATSFSAIANGGGPLNPKVRLTPSAGSRTYKVQFAAPAGGTATLNAAATYPMWFRITEV